MFLHQPDVSIICAERRSRSASWRPPERRVSTTAIAVDSGAGAKTDRGTHSDKHTEQFPRIDGQAESVFRQGTQTLLQFIGEKPAQLIAQNRDNVVFEAGTMTLRGREDIHAGEYVSLRLGTNGGSRSGFMQQAYAYSVTHEFLPYRSFTTAVQFDRGTGFIDRAQRQGGADRSYFSDMSPDAPRVLRVCFVFRSCAISAFRGRTPP